MRITKKNFTEVAEQSGCTVERSDDAVSIVRGVMGIRIAGGKMRRIGVPPGYGCDMTVGDAARLLGIAAA